MVEEVMVIDSGLFDNAIGTNNKKIIPVNKDFFFELVNNNHHFISRDLAEHNQAFKQIVSYCLIQYKEYLFVTHRTEKQTEKRLHNKYSLGIGGHISSVDSTTDNIIITGLYRELFEEVDVKSNYSIHFYGIINDNSTEVNSVHAGVCFVIALDTKQCYVKEKEKMEGFWVHKSKIDTLFNRLEGWSQILFNSYQEDEEEWKI